MTRLAGITDATAYGTPAITRTEDIPSSTALTKSYKIKFSDGTYLAPDTSKLIWQQTNPPAITAFSVFPDTVDLDISDNEPTVNVTFHKRSAGIYWFVSRQYENRQTDEGSSTGTVGSATPPATYSSLVSMGHYYIGTSGRLSGPPSDSHYYQFAIRDNDPNYQNYNKIEVNGREYNLGKSPTDFTEHGITGREYWTTDRITDSADWVADNRLTQSIKFKVSKVPDKLRFTLAVTGTPGTRVKRDSDFVFVRLENTSRYVSHIQVGSFPARGSRSIANNDVPTIGFNNILGANAGLKYFVDFTDSFVKTKTPLNLEIDGTAYSLIHIESGYTLVSLRLETFATATSPIPSGDRVTDSDLTKAINIEAVDNEQITWQRSTGTPAVRPPVSLSTGTLYFFDPHNWYQYQGWPAGKTPTHLLVNSRAFAFETVTSSSATTSTLLLPDFEPTNTNLGPFGINILFSDGTYLNNTRSYLFTVITGGNTYAQIYNARTHAKVGPQHSATGGGSISTTVPNIERPDGPTPYRLVARNSGGASHRDTTLTITKNPTLSGLRRIGSLSRPGFTNYTFGFTLTGLPQPTVTYRFSGGQTGTVPTVHLRQGDNAYTWNVINWQVTMPNANAQSLTLTATNASGSVTASLANINT